MTRRIPLLGAMMAVAAFIGSTKSADRAKVQRFDASSNYILGRQWGQALFVPRSTAGSRAHRKARRFARAHGRRM